MGEIQQCSEIEPRDDGFPKARCAFVAGHRGEHRFPVRGEDLSPEIRLRHALDRTADEVEELTKQKGDAYKERDACVATMARMAQLLGFPCGLGRHEESDTTWDKDWMNIVYIEVPHPSGKPAQLSWHIHDDEMPMFSFLPPYDEKWDGHSTEEKYQHMAEFCGLKP